MQDSITVHAALVRTLGQLPAALRRSFTWDQGTEMARHLQMAADAGIKVSFCDAASPWQRGTNENTNDLLRQYFPKSTDLSVHTPGDLARVEEETQPTTPHNPRRPQPSRPIQRPANLPESHAVAMTAGNHRAETVQFSSAAETITQFDTERSPSLRDGLADHP